MRNKCRIWTEVVNSATWNSPAAKRWTYSTADETVQQCENSANIAMAAGEAIGTVGGPSAGAFDFGLYQPGHHNVFVNPSRYHDKTLTAVCPYDQFPPDLRSQIDPLFGYPGEHSSGEAPVCGTMEVDVANTAAGVWVLQSAPVNQEGDESHFATLAPYPTFPQSLQTFSLGPAALWGFSSPGGLFRFPVVISGRVNRRFRDVTGDGLLSLLFGRRGDVALQLLRDPSAPVTSSRFRRSRMCGAPRPAPAIRPPGRWMGRR